MSTLSIRSHVPPLYLNLIKMYCVHSLQRITSHDMRDSMVQVSQLCHSFPATVVNMETSTLNLSCQVSSWTTPREAEKHDWPESHGGGQEEPKKIHGSRTIRGSASTSPQSFGKLICISIQNDKNSWVGRLHVGLPIILSAEFKCIFCIIVIEWAVGLGLGFEIR